MRTRPRCVAHGPPRRPQWPTRALNFLLALLAIVSLLPVFLLLAVLIKLTSRGPVFYLQERVGLDRRLPGPGAHNHRRAHDLGGRVFTIYKFRTMRVDAEAGGAAVSAQEQDPRVTSLGRVLRQYRLDELPQLLNVLKGEMNIVGPRPERPTIFAELRGHIAEYPLRQRAKPGITGLAQINHHYDRRSTTCAPRSATTSSTSAARACAKTCSSCSRPSPSSSCAAAGGSPPVPPVKGRPQTPPASSAVTGCLYL